MDFCLVFMRLRIFARMDTLSGRLEELMRKHGFKSQSQLARRAKVPQSTVHRILQRDDYSPSVSTLKRLANVFGVSLTWLADGRGPVRLYVAEEGADYGDVAAHAAVVDDRLDEAMSILARMDDTDRGHVLAVLRLIDGKTSRR